MKDDRIINEKYMWIANSYITIGMNK